MTAPDPVGHLQKQEAVRPFPWYSLALPFSERRVLLLGGICCSWA